MIEFLAASGVIAYSFGIALAAGCLTDEITGHEKAGGFVFLASLVALLAVGFSIVF